MSLRSRMGQSPPVNHLDNLDGNPLTLSVESSVHHCLKQELFERIGLHNLAQLAQDPDKSHAYDELSIVLEGIFNTLPYGHIDHMQRQQIIRRVIDEICGLGPIQPLLDDPEITEVMINGTQGLFYERKGELFASKRVFESEDQIMLVIDRILAPLGRRLDRASPLVNARLANGDRVHAVAPPVALDGPAVTIRKFSHETITLEKLVALTSLPEWYGTLLSWAVKARKSLAVAGATGTGKTTLLNALSCEIPGQERIVTIEDSAELKFTAHPNVVRLEAREASIEGKGRINIRELVKNALRMRPDRIVVGEVRGEECIDMLQAMSTGHEGSLTTLHAGSIDEALLRLVLMARFGMDLPARLIQEQVASALDLVVMTHRLAQGTRLIGDLAEITPCTQEGFSYHMCVTLDEHERRWRLIHEPSWVEDLCRSGMVSDEEVSRWRSLQEAAL